MNTTELLESIRQRAYAPSATTTGSSDTEFIAMANEELRSGLGPYLMKVREDFFVRSYSYTVLSTTNTYRIPSRALGANIKSIQHLDASGNEQDFLNRLDDKDLDNDGYVIEGGSIILRNSPVPVGDTIRIKYYARPSKLVDSSRVFAITSLASSRFNGATVPLIFNTLDAIDVQRPNLVFENVYIDETPDSATAGVGGFVNIGETTYAAVGDYVAKAGEAFFPQIPEDLHPLLAQRVATQWLSVSGDDGDYSKAKERLKVMEEELLGIISARADGDKVITVGRNGLVSGIRTY